MLRRLVVFAVLALASRTALAATANLSAQVFADDATVSNGDTVTYLVIATNNGPDVAVNPVLVDALQTGANPATAQFVDGSEPAGGTLAFAVDLAMHTATCSIQGGGQLAVGEKLLCRFTVQLAGLGPSVNNVTATNDFEAPGDTGNTGNTSTFIQDPPPPTFAPAAIALGAISTGGAMAVVATNPDNTAFLNVASIAASCGAHATCAIAPDACTGARITPHATCGFTVTATCVDGGAIAGSVTFTDFSTGSPESLPITGNCIEGSKTTLVSSAPASTFGAPVTFTATVTAGATGTVTFLDGATSLGTSPLGGGTATLATGALAVGAHAITASYGGDASFTASTSEALTETIAQATTTTTLASSPNPADADQTVVFTATVAAGATGTVAFLENTTTLGTGTLGASGTATFSTTLDIGTHAIVAQYIGDASFAGSTSAPLQQTVTGEPDYGIAASPATLTIASGGTGMATITVTPVNAFTGTLALACTDLPDDASCLFEPASAHLDGTNAPVTVQLRIDTALPMAVSASRKTGGGRGALLLFGAVGVFGGKRRRGAKLALLLGIACGSTAAPHTTPPGTYALSVNATGAMNHSTSLGVVVD